MRQCCNAAEPARSYLDVLLTALRVLVPQDRELQPCHCQDEARKNTPHTDAGEVRDHVLLEPFNTVETDLMRVGVAESKL